MTKLLKKNKNFELKSKIVNTLMINGKKKTSEKILLKSVKLVQKSTNKNFKSLLTLSLINSAPAFKINEQVVKKGKRKAVRNIPAFIMSDYLRITNALKSTKNLVFSNRNSTSFYEAFVKEILASASLKSQIIDRKNELQKQVLINRRYLSKFRW